MLYAMYSCFDLLILLSTSQRNYEAEGIYILINALVLLNANQSPQPSSPPNPSPLSSASKRLKISPYVEQTAMKEEIFLKYVRLYQSALFANCLINFILYFCIRASDAERYAIALSCALAMAKSARIPHVRV